MNLQPMQNATLKVDAATIRAYAELTDDFNPIHLDPEFAAATPLGGVIAHGTLSVCLLLQALFRSFGERAFDGLDLDIRFIKPVRIGETLLAGGEPGGDGHYNVWVRANDGSDRVVGTLHSATSAEQPR
jgi:3-hydroxybutyryl-CoA dehydratase